MAVVSVACVSSAALDRERIRRKGTIARSMPGTRRETQQSAAGAEPGAAPSRVPLWTPDAERVSASALEAFRLAAAAVAGRELRDYDELHAWSVAEPELFWPALARFLALPLGGSARRAVSDGPMVEAAWFEGATLNFAEALLYPRAVTDPDQTAIIALSETDFTGERRLSYRELRALVARVAGALRASGVGPGDQVVAFAANVPETVAVLLACAGIGAVFATCSPDFGEAAAAARFGQLAPKLLFATTVYRYGGKRFDTSKAVAALARELAVDVVRLPSHGEEDATAEAPGASWEEWLARGPERTALELSALPFDQPLYVLFSSGTTGKPKALVHRAGGALLTHAKEQRLHLDIRPGDTVVYFTTCGWMMWNWLVSVLAQGAAAVLYDGSPSHPDPTALLEAADRLGFTLFGTSARFVHALMAAGVTPRERFALERLRTVAVTGSPLATAGYAYIYDSFKPDLHLASVSGGTDIVGCFMIGVPTLPVYAGELQRPALGVDLAVYDETGTELSEGPGELVCRKPLPSMPLRLVDDPTGSRYRAAYFEAFPGVWRHGDLIERTPTGGVIVHGRSDATLNPGGVRIGTAEIYRPLEAVGEVVEAAAVGRQEPGSVDQEIWLFVVLEGSALTRELAATIRAVLRSEASPRHVPKRIFSLSELPRTRSGKPMELAIAQLVNRGALTNLEVIANPEVLREVEAAAENPDSGL